MEERMCKTCGESYLLDNDNYRPEKNKTGWSYTCRHCIREKARAYYEQTAEKQKQASLERYYADRDNKIRQMRSWYRKNRKQEIEKQIERNNQNIERLRETHRRYIRNNPDKNREYCRRRNQEKTFKLSQDDWQYCKSYFDNSCAYCGITEEDHLEQVGQGLHKEHVVNDGRNDLKNCVPSCKACNSQKHKKPLNEWYTPDNKVYSRKRYMKIYQWLRFGCRKLEN